MIGEYSNSKQGAERRKLSERQSRVAYSSHSETMGSSPVTWALPRVLCPLTSHLCGHVVTYLLILYLFLFRVLTILPKIKLANLKDYSMLRKILMKYQYIIFWGIPTFDWGFPRDKSLKSKGMNLKSWAFHVSFGSWELQVFPKSNHTRGCWFSCTLAMRYFIKYSKDSNGMKRTLSLQLSVANTMIEYHIPKNYTPVYTIG